jgi:CheY-like chemotaxis protein
VAESPWDSVKPHLRVIGGSGSDSSGLTMARASHPSGFRRGRPVLYVGRQAYNRAVIGRIDRRRQPVRFLVATSGQAALGIAAQRPLRLVIVESDLVDGHGADWVTALRHGMVAPAPVVILAEGRPAAERARFLWAGASLYLSDPSTCVLSDGAVNLLLEASSWR